MFPKILFLLFGVVSGHNLRVLMFFSLVLAALQCLMLMHHTARNARVSGLGRGVFLLWVMYSVFLFSPVQRQNWLWRFQLQWSLNLLAVGAGGYIFANARPSTAAVAGLTACGAVATFSLSSGMLYWVVMLFFMLAGRRFDVSKFSIRQIGLLVAAFAGIFVLYMVGYEKPSAHPSLLVFMDAPADFFLYVAAYTGGPMAIGRTMGEAVFWGSLGILLFLTLMVMLLRKADAAQLRFGALFMILGTYSLLSGVLTAVGRAGLGPGQALASRYTSVSILLWISVLSLLVLSAVGSETGQGAGKRVKMFLVYAFFGIFTVSSLFSMGTYAGVYRSRMCGLASVLQPSHPECLVQLYPDPRRLREKDVPTLKRLKLSVFAEPAPKGK